MAEYMDVLSRTWATYGVSMAPTRAQQLPEPEHEQRQIEKKPTSSFEFFEFNGNVVQNNSNNNAS